MRLDQWLWAVRLYRTRTLAASAIKDGEVSVDGVTTKPAREVQPGQMITARTGDITRTYRAIGNPPARVGAALVPLYAEDRTPPEEFIRQRDRDRAIAGIPLRPRGAGRPTKRDRRAVERLQDDQA